MDVLNRWENEDTYTLGAKYDSESDNDSDLIASAQRDLKFQQSSSEEESKQSERKPMKAKVVRKQPSSDRNRAPEPESSGTSGLETPKKSRRAMSSRSRRPGSAVINPGPRGKYRKTDLVNQHNMRRSQWKAVAPFTNGLQGRKLSLCERNYENRNKFELVKETRMKMYQYVPPHEKRRDSLRLELRSWMAQHPSVIPYN